MFSFFQYDNIYYHLSLITQKKGKFLAIITVVSASDKI